MSAAQDTVDNIEVRFDSLEGEYADFMVATKALIQDQTNTLQGEFQVFHDELFKLRSFVQDKL